MMRKTCGFLLVGFLFLCSCTRQAPPASVTPQTDSVSREITAWLLKSDLTRAMANMSAVCYKYRYTVKPFLIVPIIGAMFADLINTAIITLFLNLM